MTLYRIAYLIACLALLSLLSCREARNSDQVATLIEHLNRSTVVVYAERFSDGEVRYVPKCGGVWISRFLFLTAFHCVEENGEFNAILDLVGYAKATPEVDRKVRFRTYQSLTLATDNSVREVELGAVLLYDVGADVAVVAAQYRLSHDTVRMADAVPKSGTPVVVVGHTSGLLYSSAPGTVSGERFMASPRSNGQLFTQVVAAAAKGNSGGGAFTEDGELVGLCSFTVGGAPGVSFFVHPRPINLLLESLHMRD